MILRARNLRLRVGGSNLIIETKTILMLLLKILATSAHSRGAPMSTCAVMLPQHGGYPQSSEPPYEIIPSKDQIYFNETLKVTIRVKNNGGHFLGYLIEAKPTAFWRLKYQKAVGNFVRTLGVKLLNCFDELETAATHAVATEFREVVLEWRPPYRFAGQITFVATLVREFREYWILVPSPPVTIIP